VFRKLDPTGQLPIAELLAKVAPHAAAYRRLVVDNEHHEEDIKLALKIYNKFYLIQFKQEWGEYVDGQEPRGYPAVCTCVECYSNGCC
jgi:hypothetical protein